MTTNDTTYNGWSNWETWNANLWLTNDRGAYDLVLETLDGLEGWRAGDALQELVEELAEEGIELIGDEMTMWRVDWREIAEAFLEE